MELKDALLCRRSVRTFTNEAVMDEEIAQLLHAAMAAPSACNRTPWEFYVVTQRDALRELRGATRFSNIEAPLAIVVCGNLTRALPLKMSEYWIQDCSAATENLLLRAVDLSLGAVWCGLHPQKAGVEKVRKALDIPAWQIPLNILYIGHPARTPEPRDQYDEKYVHWVKKSN